MGSSKKYSNGFWKVYVHTNKTNGKRYVGITSQKPEYRWNYGKAYKANPHFYSAICKYGWDGFEHEVLFDHLSESEAKDKEIELIAKWKTQDRLYGYNVTAGGESANGYDPPPELRQLWSEIRKGYKHSEETKQKMREASTKNYEKCRKALAEAKYKPVDMFSLDWEYIRSFRSIIEAAEELHLSNACRGHISDVCSGKRKSAGGYRWQYTQ